MVDEAAQRIDTKSGWRSSRHKSRLTRCSSRRASESAEKARNVIRGGQVGRRRPSRSQSGTWCRRCDLRGIGARSSGVRRGGIKLAAASDSFGSKPATGDRFERRVDGGIPARWLQRGARKVIASTRTSADWKREASRVTVIENTNARHRRRGDCPNAGAPIRA